MRASARESRPSPSQLVEEVAEAVGEVEGSARAGEARVGGDQAADEAGEVELATEGGHRRGQDDGAGAGRRGAR